MLFKSAWLPKISAYYLVQVVQVRKCAPQCNLCYSHPRPQPQRRHSLPSPNPASLVGHPTRLSRSQKLEQPGIELAPGLLRDELSQPAVLGLELHSGGASSQQEAPQASREAQLLTEAVSASRSDTFCLSWAVVWFNSASRCFFLARNRAEASLRRPVQIEESVSCRGGAEWELELSSRIPPALVLLNLLRGHVSLSYPRTLLLCCPLRRLACCDGRPGRGWLLS